MNAIEIGILTVLSLTKLNHYARFLQQERDIFTIGAAGVGGTPTVGVLGPPQSSRPYRCHCRGGW